MGPIINDIRIEAEVPAGSQRPGAAVPVTLRFFNVSAESRTLFFIAAENLRFGQSTFRFRPRSLPPQIQPIARDGYVARESDFHPIAPQGQLVFTQTLHLARNIPAGDLGVDWVYENRIESWPSTLPRGGERIPGIWRGSLTHTFKVSISRS